MQRAMHLARCRQLGPLAVSAQAHLLKAGRAGNAGSVAPRAAAAVTRRFAGGRRGWAIAAQVAETEALEEKLSLTFVAPHVMFYADAEVSKVDVPGLTGDMGLLPAHVPIVAVLKPGVVSVFESESSEAAKYFVSSGSCTVNKDSSVQIVADEAVPLDELSIAGARAGLNAFTAVLGSADSEGAKAEAAIGVGIHQAMLKALGAE